jgi:hypothetical protein
MRLGSEIDNGVDFFFKQNLLNQPLVGNTAVDKTVVRRFLDSGEILEMPRIGQRIQVDDPVPGIVFYPVADKVRTDKTGPPVTINLRMYEAPLAYSPGCRASPG